MNKPRLDESFNTKKSKDPDLGFSLRYFFQLLKIMQFFQNKLDENQLRLAV